MKAKEELCYGYKKLTYPDGTVKYLDIMMMDNPYKDNYKEITEEQAKRNEKECLRILPKIRRANEKSYREFLPR